MFQINQRSHSARAAILAVARSRAASLSKRSRRGEVVTDVMRQRYSSAVRWRVAGVAALLMFVAACAEVESARASPVRLPVPAPGPNPWLYGSAARGAFFDVVTGSNDLAGVGCCTAGPGCDTASGLGVHDWETLPATLPPPA